MAAQTYGVLLLSFSRHSHQSSFVPLFVQHPRIRLIAVTDEPDISPELDALNQQWADTLSIPYLRDLDQALTRNDVDVVSIGHEIERRATLCRRTAAAGKHLWIDKFLGANLAECDAVVQAIEQAGTKAIVPSYTYGPLVQRSRSALRDASLGKLLGMHVDILFGKGWPRPIQKTARAPHFLPAGRWRFHDIKRELLTVGAYGVALVQACLGPITQVYGQAGAYFFPEHARRGADDFGTLTLSDADGRLATLCAGRIGPAIHPAGGPSQAYLFGSEGTVFINGKGPQLNTMMRQDITGPGHRPDPHDPMQWASGPPGMQTSLDGDTAGLGAGLEDLVAALDEDRPPHFSVRQARNQMAVLLAGYRSVVEGGPITPEPPLENKP